MIWSDFYSLAMSLYPKIFNIELHIVYTYAQIKVFYDWIKRNP